MLRLTPLLLLQGFCIYHAYKHKADWRWYLLIIILPLIGCLIYLYVNFVNKQNINTVSKGVKSVINTSYELEQLEKQMAFSDTIQNKTLVADKYVELERYSEAIDLYESCLEGFNENDPKIIKKLTWVCYLTENYERSVFYGNKVKSDPYFLKSKDAIGYAWSLFYVGQQQQSEELFSKMDVAFANYVHRMEYAKFLHESDRQTEAISKLEEVMAEFEHMEVREKREQRGTIRAIQQLYDQYLRGT
ncbi:MAG: hypothetical protein HEP71_34555 [Roseivirga sp.]|nr:hypothetical protein [Roseivirga sp.]